MKFVIIGMHSSGKHEIAHTLQDLGLKYGKNFSNIEDSFELHKIYGEFEQYSNRDITDIFENNAYVYIHEHQDKYINNSYQYFEGLSKYTYDNNDVFVMSPDQFMSISVSNMPDDVVWVWLDNTKTNRQNRFKLEHGMYDFNYREQLEKGDIKEFVKTLYNVSNNMLYFTNEDPGRISSIIYSIYKYPDLLEIFTKNYN